LEPIGDLINLDILSLGVNSVDNLKPLENLTNLTTLSIITHSVSNLDAVGKLKNITKLHFSVRKITNLEFIRDMVNLETLHLVDMMTIFDLTPLKGLAKLKTIRCSNVRLLNAKLLDNVEFIMA
jgi:internalin A